MAVVCFWKKKTFWWSTEWHWTPHLPCRGCADRAGVDCSTMETVYTGFFSVPWYSTEPYHLKKTSIPQKWDTLNALIKIIQRMLQSSHHPVFIVSLSSDDPNHMRGSICRNPAKRQATHSHYLLRSFRLSSPPRSRSIPSLPWGSQLKKPTSFTKTQILQHMLPPFPPQPSKGNIKNKAVTDRWADSHNFVITCQCQGVNECRKGGKAVQMSRSDTILI